ncbi:hypothetical protein IU449_28640 [Nocardia higoensis]|uniref:Uncharacterized protein n=1 Tax=Nocardia higoensis TaxID=228599 RepID=A0ABS0DN08_9NOCA|nr:hypothetical protein [Nocardia higoensis]MBF6358469.1 hypothetical protein [Nocardia higoensis]
MPQTFVIDQAATFTAVAFLSSAPRMVFGKDGEQDRTVDGLPKWEVQCVAGFRDMRGNASHEVIKVNVAAHTDPGADLASFTPVQLVGFIVGVVPPEVRKDERTGRERLSGGTVWYRADSIRSTAVPANARTTKAGE